MRPSRRPTVTRNGRASIVAWFPQTPQPDAHHTHYRIRRFCEAMIVTPIGTWVAARAHPSARLCVSRDPRAFALVPSGPGAAPFSRQFPPVPASAPIHERLFPATRLLFWAGMHLTVPVSPPCPPTHTHTHTKRERDFVLASLVPRSSPALGFSSPPGGASEKRGRGSRQRPHPPDYVVGLMHKRSLPRSALPCPMSSLAARAQMAASLVVLSRG